MSNNNKPYSAGRIILFAIVVSIAIYLLTQKFSGFLEQEYGFAPASHGTLSSWMIYLLLLVTLVYLYKILHSQLSVQREQTSLNKLYAYQIRSQHHADITFVMEGTSSHDEASHFLMPSFKITKKSAYNVKVACDLNHSLSQPYSIKKVSGGYEANASTLPEGSTLTVTLLENILDSTSSKATQESTLEEDLPVLTSYKIKFRYLDEFGLAYAKTFILSYSLQDQKLHCLSSNVDYL